MQVRSVIKEAFELLPMAWVLISDQRPSSSRAFSEDVLVTLGDMSWLVQALLWGHNCPDDLSEAWINSICQVLSILEKI